jgi:GRF zinc finger
MDNLYEIKTRPEWIEGQAERAESHTCTTCTRELPALTVKKGGPNTGRRFITSPACENFFWLDRDYQNCPDCETMCPVLTVKKPGSPHIGRRFLSCRCGRFTWAS